MRFEPERFRFFFTPDGATYTSTYECHRQASSDNRRFVAMSLCRLCHRLQIYKKKQASSLEAGEHAFPSYYVPITFGTTLAYG